ncbi:MAG: L-threonine 3-dehydrogenase [Chlamydiales bacterium]|nr:L-threonine 3-dehydrogenase [Chlamydiales bacterium]MCH9620178.1 L-threonine 3-dehydrogenase [Chlamydiales bacterium]MCH9623107.1 L-threonine 3-dehydrogenase [Chlamydiales bacterium]
MKAIVKKEPKEGVWVEDVPIPVIGEDDLLIKIEKTSICGTDVHLYKWDEWASKTLPVPSTIGHEFVGRVVEIGKNVKGFKEGDRVSGEGHITCGRCYQCRIGKRVLCPHTVGVGVNRDGCFAEFLSIPASNAFPVPESISDEVACIFDPMGNAVHTALSCDLVGKDVLITGAGPIGLMSIPIAKKAGARNVVISDLNPYRLELAKKMNPTRVVDISKESVKSAIKEIGMTEGFEVCLEMSGSPKAFEELPDLATTGGQLILLGILPSHAAIDWVSVIFKMLTIKGIYGRRIFETWYQMCHLLESGLDITPVITHRYSADDFQKGFDAMLSGNAGKVILDWTC